MEKPVFTILDDNKDIISQLISPNYEALREEIEYIVNGFCDNAIQDVEYAFSLIGDSLAVRVLDMGRYVFPYPFALTDDADLKGAIESIVYYCITEELPVIFTDVPPDDISVFSALGYKNVRIRRECMEAPTYRVELITECLELNEIPTVSCGVLSVGELFESDISEYAKICSDTEGINLWGYDYREDMPNAAEVDFYNAARLEFERGVSVTAAIRMGDALIGEVILYAFDAKGGADFAYRIVKDMRGRGIGKEILPLIFDLGRTIGLNYIMADVKKENKASISVLSRHMIKIAEREEAERYKISL